MARNKTDDSEAWRSKDLKDSAAYASPIAVEIGGVRQIIVFTDKSLAGIAAADGKLLWRHARPGDTAVIPTALLTANHVVVTAGYGVGCRRFKITAEGGKFSAEKVYSNKNMINHHGGVILLDGKVYGYTDGIRGQRNGGWACVDFMTGEQVWREPKLGKGTTTFADGRLYCRDEKKNPGEVALIDARRQGWNERGRVRAAERRAGEGGGSRRA